MGELKITWIEGRVHVAEPEGDGKAPGCNITGRAKWLQNVEKEEGKPAEDKGA